MIRKLNKPYITMLKEDIGPYLIKRTAINGTLRREIYTFLVPLSSIDRQTFVALVKRYKCWEYNGEDYYAYTSSASTMRAIADKMEKEQINDILANRISNGERRSAVVDLKEPINDIPSDMLDASRYVEQFKQMEKNVNKDKFSVQNKTYIKVNGKDFTLTSPFDADASLGVILELTERLAVLTDKMTQLDTINNNSIQTDLIAIDKVLAVAVNEISEIKEMIDFINDNIEEDE